MDTPDPAPQEQAPLAPGLPVPRELRGGTASIRNGTSIVETERGELAGRTDGALGAAELDRVALPSLVTLPSLRQAPAARPRLRTRPAVATDPYAPLFAAGLTAVLCLLWVFAADRDGSWRQVPYWDMGWFHGQALSMLRALQENGLSGFADAWMNRSGTHTPLVPGLSALFMAVLGPSRMAAELVLPLASFVTILSTFRIAELLFGRRTAWGSAALVATFPVVLTYGRLYFYEGAFAACIAASSWAALASEGFTRWKPTLAFGVLAGLTALARAAGFVYLTGILAAVVVFEWRRPQRPWRALRLGAAGVVGAAVAATWYLPNFDQIFGYLTSVTYGVDAKVFTGGSSALSIDNALYYVEWLLLDGPGIPMAAVALLAFAAGAIHRGRPGLVSREVLWVLTVFTVDFAIAIAGSQRMSGKFVLPLMPFVAILVVRAVVQVPWPRPRVATALAVALLGLHHWIGCTFTFDTSFQSPGVTFQGSTPGMHVASLVNHRSFYLDWAKSGNADATLDYKVPETLDRVLDLRLLPGSSIAYFGEHVFISASSFQLENERRGLHFGFWNPPGLRTSDRPGWLEEHERALTQASAVILRSNRPEDGVSTAYTELFHSLNDGVKFDFAPMGEPLTLGDGSVLFFYRCRPRKDPAVTRLGAGG